MFDKTLGFLNDHFSDGNVPSGRFVKGGADYFTFHATFHVRHLFGAFVDQQDNQVALWMVLLDAACDILQDNRFTRPRWRHNQRPLTLTNRRYQINHTCRAILDGRIVDFHIQTLIGIERRQVVERDLMARPLGIFVVDLSDRSEREITFVVIWSLDLTFDCITGTQGMLTDRFRRTTCPARMTG